MRGLSPRFVLRLDGVSSGDLKSSVKGMLLLLRAVSGHAISERNILHSSIPGSWESPEQF